MVIFISILRFVLIAGVLYGFYRLVISGKLVEWTKPRTIFAALFYGTLCYLLIRQFPIPEILKEITSFLMGFYFGQKMPEQKGEGNK